MKKEEQSTKVMKDDALVRLVQYDTGVFALHQPDGEVEWNGEECRIVYHEFPSAWIWIQAKRQGGYPQEIWVYPEGADHPCYCRASGEQDRPSVCHDMVIHAPETVDHQRGIYDLATFRTAIIAIYESRWGIRVEPDELHRAEELLLIRDHP